MARLREKLDPLEDFELWMWMGMTIATHAVNAALHQAGLTKSDNYYSYHVVGLYVVPPARDGEWRKEALPLGDIVHVDLPPVRGELPPPIQRAFAALKVLEDMRDPYIRRAEPITPQLVESCRNAYRICIREVCELLPKLREQLHGI
ncbi:MAG: hypothetical protein IT531_15395 [Burkholderiales bacterium]|nr:hypothetical protein [Burkholderiales bacterium]